MMLYSSFSSWISQFLNCMGSCIGCCINSDPIIAVDKSSKGHDDYFWSTSTCDLGYNSAMQSQRSFSSITASTQNLSIGSASNHPEFVNHGVRLWNQSRLQWRGNKKLKNQGKKEPVLNWNADYENLLGTSKRFPEPIPLSEMVDFLVDIWDQEGLYE